MGRLRPKIAAVTVTAAIASASLLALAQPAAAVDYINCESYQSKIGYCDLYPDAGAHNQRWMVNGIAQSRWDNSSTMIGVPCSPGTWENISVSYLNDYGASMTVGDSLRCSSGPPL
jgi:hypothetical protein